MLKNMPRVSSDDFDSQLVELTQQRDGLQQRTSQLADSFETHMETAEASARAAERLATEQRVRAKMLEQQLARMDGLPAALIASQRALQAVTRRERARQIKLDKLSEMSKPKAVVKKSNRHQVIVQERTSGLNEKELQMAALEAVDS